MAIFREIERRLENLVEGFFTHRFSSALQPVELAHKLASETDRKRQVSVSQTYAPNVFMIHLSPEDFDELDAFQQALAHELTAYVKAHAEQKGYRFTGSVHISVAPEAELRRGESVIHSHIEEIDLSMPSGGTQIISKRELKEAINVSPKGRLVETDSGVAHDVGASTTIGRRGDNTIVLAHQGISRYHARIEADQDDFFLVDLDSTNGTSLNGEEIGRVKLVSGDTLTLGPVEMRFDLLEQ